MISEKINKSIEKALVELGIENKGIHLEHPENFSLGDYSTNIAMALGKVAKKNPKELAEEISNALRKDLPSEIEKVEVAGFGFINFYLKKEFFIDSIEKIIKTENFGKGSVLEGKKILFEYTDPNAFKEFHIGHLMSNAIGEALSRLSEMQGGEVKRLCYGSDIGLPVAKAVFGMIKNRPAFPEDGDLLNDKIKFLGDSYVYGNTSYEEDPSEAEEIKLINKKLFDKSDPELQIYYEKGRKWSLEYLESIYKILGTTFNKFYWESEMSEPGKKIVLDAKEKGVFEESEGAIVFKGENYGLHTRVFINSIGLPTYEAKEMGLLLAKDRDFKYDESFYITANEQNDYFKVIKKASTLLYPNLGEKIVHISHGLMRFADGKMSSRKGGVITGMSLVNDLKELAKEKVKDREFSDEEKDILSEKVAVGAVKFSILRQSPGKDIIFDREKALSFEGESGPYLEYALVRSKSILEKAKDSGIKEVKISEEWNPSSLEKNLYKYPEVLERAWIEFAPQSLVEYLVTLASDFNSFYANEKIVDENDPNSFYKIKITKAFSEVMESGLNILAIPVLSKM